MCTVYTVYIDVLGQNWLGYFLTAWNGHSFKTRKKDIYDTVHDGSNAWIYYLPRFKVTSSLYTWAVYTGMVCTWRPLVEKFSILLWQAI
jgi:hypothetical protein